MIVDRRQCDKLHTLSLLLGRPSDKLVTDVAC